MRAPQLARRLRRQGGYTLIELLVVLATFLTIATALTTLFVSGAEAELDANARFQAQQNARLALDRLRRELHCSTGLTQTDGSALPPSGVSTIRVALPSYCPAADGVTTTIDYTLVAKGPSRWELRRTKGSSTVPIADFITTDAVFTYTAQQGGTEASRAILHVDLPVNVDPNEGWSDWRLADDIVLRNTLRQDP